MISTKQLSGTSLWGRGIIGFYTSFFFFKKNNLECPPSPLSNAFKFSSASFKTSTVGPLWDSEHYWSWREHSDMNTSGDILQHVFSLLVDKSHIPSQTNNELIFVLDQKHPSGPSSPRKHTLLTIWSQSHTHCCRGVTSPVIPTDGSQKIL